MGHGAGKHLAPIARGNRIRRWGPRRRSAEPGRSLARLPGVSCQHRTATGSGAGGGEPVCRAAGRGQAVPAGARARPSRAAEAVGMQSRRWRMIVGVRV